MLWYLPPAFLFSFGLIYLTFKTNVERIEHLQLPKGGDFASNSNVQIFFKLPSELKILKLKLYCILVHLIFVSSYFNKKGLQTPQS